MKLVCVEYIRQDGVGCGYDRNVIHFPIGWIFTVTNENFVSHDGYNYGRSRNNIESTLEMLSHWYRFEILPDDYTEADSIHKEWSKKNMRNGKIFTRDSSRIEKTIKMISGYGQKRNLNKVADGYSYVAENFGLVPLYSVGVMCTDVYDSNILMDILQEEGFTWKNSGKLPTYYSERDNYYTDNPNYKTIYVLTVTTHVDDASKVEFLLSYNSYRKEELCDYNIPIVDYRNIFSY